jgi:deoxyguanosine kinase
MIIALEGLPGAGKTTMARLLGDRLEVEVVCETTGDHPFLTQVYEDGMRDDLTVELAFLLVHANPYRRMHRRGTTICDFSPAKDILFAEDMLDPESLSVFRSVYDHVYRDHPLPDLVIYLEADPALCLERVQRRMSTSPERTFEAGMTEERLTRMARRYQAALGDLGAEYLTYDVPAERPPPEMAADLISLMEGRSVPAIARSR